MKEIMTPKHSEWNIFHMILCSEKYVNMQGLDDANEIRHFDCHGDHTHTRAVLERYFPNIDLEVSIMFFKEHGGYCDCEVLMNVEDSYNATE